MVAEPLRDMGRVVVGQFDHRADPQPSKERMKAGTAWREAPFIVVTLGGAKPPEEQEEVADPHAVISQVRLRRADLPERRAPTWSASTTPRIEVRIEVHRYGSIVLPAGQVQKQVSQRKTRCATEKPARHE